MTSQNKTTMKSLHVKKGDTVKILAGDDKGKTGKIVLVLPDIQKVVVEGINMMKRHQKSRKQGQKGQIVEKAMPVHVSNVAKTEKAEKKAKVVTNAAPKVVQAKVVKAKAPAKAKAKAKVKAAEVK